MGKKDNRATTSDTVETSMASGGKKDRLIGKVQH
jgi:hypothetical protein